MIYSKKSYLLSTEELAERAAQKQEDVLPYGKYKKKKLRDLSAAERAKIVHSNVVDGKTQVDIAREY